MKITVTLQADLIVEFDENSDQFKEMYEYYKRYINDHDYEDFANNICSQVARYGATDFIEGVGYLKINGNCQKNYQEKGCPEIDCPVNIIGDFDLNDKCDFEIFYTQIEE